MKFSKVLLSVAAMSSIVLWGGGWVAAQCANGNCPYSTNVYPTVQSAPYTTVSYYAPYENTASTPYEVYNGTIVNYAPSQPVVGAANCCGSVCNNSFQPVTSSYVGMPIDQSAVVYPAANSFPSNTVVANTVYAVNSSPAYPVGSYSANVPDSNIVYATNSNSGYVVDSNSGGYVVDSNSGYVANGCGGCPINSNTVYYNNTAAYVMPAASPCPNGRCPRR